MKNLALLFCLSALIACTNKPVDPSQASLPQVSLRGTYNVSYLTQYQNGKLVFDGRLPAVINNKITIKHALSVDLSTLEPSPTYAYVGYAAYQSWGNYSRSYGRPVTSNQTILRAAQSISTFGFYDNNGSLLGSSDGNTLSFDFTVPDSLGHSVRYVYKAVKVSPKPNYFTFSY